MDDLITIGGELCVVEHLIVSNEIDGVVGLACVDVYLHISIDVEFLIAGEDSLVSGVDEGFLVKHYV